MSTASRLGQHRWVGDKATRRLVDTQSEDVDFHAIDQLVKSCRLSTFSPDTLAEANNRGYRQSKSAAS